MSSYPERHHPIFFLVDALNALGAKAEFAKDERTEECWGAVVNGKTMVWLIDNRHEHEREHEDPAAERLLSKGALVCHAQLRDKQRAGGHWLPLAVTPGYAPDYAATKRYNAGFVGYVRDPQRSTMAIHLGAFVFMHVKESLFGTEAVEFYNQCRIGANFPTLYGTEACYDINMRVFEVMATSAVLLTNNLPELKMLDLDRACVTYNSPDDLVTQAANILSWSDERQRMVSRAANEIVFSSHTYEARAKKVLEWLS